MLQPRNREQIAKIHPKVLRPGLVFQCGTIPKYSPKIPLDTDKTFNKIPKIAMFLPSWIFGVFLMP